MFHFEIAQILRNALLISSILSNSEVWYGVTKQEIDQREQIDEMLLRNLLYCSRNVPKYLLYLEMGYLPSSCIIKERRLMFLHQILQQLEESLVFRFFKAQIKSPTTHDWDSTVLELPINIETGEKVTNGAFKYLIKE